MEVCVEEWVGGMLLAFIESSLEKGGYNGTSEEHRHYRYL